MPYFILGDFNADRQAALPVAAARRAAARLLARLVARHFERNLAAMTAGRLKPLDPQCKNDNPSLRIQEKHPWGKRIRIREKCVCH